MVRKAYFLLLVLTLIVFANGCWSTQTGQNPSVSTGVNGEQAKVLQSYLDNLAKGKFSDAYELLASVNKKQITKDDFITYYNLNRNLSRITVFKIETGSKLSNLTYDTVKYQDAYLFKISETFAAIPNNKTSTVSGQLKVVKENNVWRVLRESNKTIKQMISQTYANLGWKSGPEKPTETINNFNQALKFDPNNPQAYLGLSVLELQLKGYAKAIAYANQGLSKTKSSTVKSQFHSVVGQAYLELTDLANANQFFTVALKEDPNNTNAQQGINNVKKTK